MRLFTARRTGAGWHNQIMETLLSPLEFARRTRRLHGDRKAVVDGDLLKTATGKIQKFVLRKGAPNLAAQ
jgi:hypothetical protein